MKLVTFDAGRVGRLEGEGDDAVVVELDCASTREWFERGGQVGETGERLPLATGPAAGADRAEEVLPHRRQLRRPPRGAAGRRLVHPVHKGIVFFQNVDAIIGPDDAIVYPEGLTKELDYELELAIIIGRSGKFFGPEQAADYSPGTRSSTTSRPATSSAGRCSPACSRSPRRSTPSARSARGS
jgi:2-keto-4-pentenoate hydratase/2-oxohepta-3-ene-1,7-dioic acid hydratase (catechol pathway)